MWMVWLFGGGLIGIGALYWLVVLAEGAYFGPWAVRLVYTLGARHYDAVRRPWQAEDADTLLPTLLAALAGNRRPAVLDVATGTGRVPLLLAGSPGFSGTIDALDLTPAMLDQARARQAAACPAAPIRWHLGEAGRLPWPAHSFDMVTCLEALEYFPRPRRALAELGRVLREEGTLVISKVPDRWARLLPGRAFTRRGLRHELERLGFAHVAIRSWQPGHYELVIASRSGK